MADGDPRRAPGRESVTRRPLPERALRTVLLAAVVLSPLLITAVLGSSAWFAWRMFSVVNGEVRYEVVEGDDVQTTDLDGLSTWDRRAHIGTRNLEALCDRHEHADTARRLIDGVLDAEVTCP